MSRGRHNFQYRMPDWRAVQYKNQKAFFRKRELPKFQFVQPFVIKPSTLSVILMVSVIGHMLVPVQAQFVVPNKIMTNLVTAKMVRDPALPSAVRNQLSCHHIARFFASTAQKLPVVQAPMLRVLKHPDVNVVCTTRERMDANAGPQTEAFCNYQDGKLSIFLNENPVNERTLAHEITHADWFLLHRGKQCFEPDVATAYMPMKSFSEQGALAYHKALNKGDNRIREFKTLLIKKKSGKSLNQIEQERLQIYLAAVTDCLPVVIHVIFPEDYYQRISQYFNDHPNENSVNIITPDNQHLVVLRMKAFNNEYMLPCYRPDIADSIAEHADIVQHNLQEIPESNFKMRLSERDAYTFENLSRQARETFYAEAHAMREAEMEKCSDKEHQFIRVEL